jgi:hypothetical protein
MVFESMIVTEAAATPPMVTDVAPVKVEPLIVTVCPPVSGPETGLILTTVGAAWYVYNVFAALVPLGVVTRMLADPTTPAGAVAVMVVPFTTVTPVAATPPIVTIEVPMKFVPVMVTACPPPRGPDAGFTPITVGDV